MNKTIQFTLQSPKKCTEDQYQEWVTYHLGLTDISEDNPLKGYDMAGNVDNLTIDGQDVD